MFQYAAARRLAYANGTRLKLDIGWFKNSGGIDTVRNYALNKLNIKEDFASSREIKKYVRKDPRKTVGRILAYLPFNKGEFVLEKYYHFDPGVLKLPDNIYLEGYWQSEKYFSDIEDVIRREFTVKMEPDPMNRQIAESIERSEAVSVHVRRGDYVLNPSTSVFHGICTLDYYREAIENIASHAQRPHFYFFSDEPEWVKENLNPGYPATFIDHNGPDKACEDMRLMSLCKHHVIANSSFSWWGAWLCRNPEKIVIAPKRWFKKEDMNTRNLIPEKWIRI